MIARIEVKGTMARADGLIQNSCVVEEPGFNPCGFSPGPGRYAFARGVCDWCGKVEILDWPDGSPFAHFEDLLGWVRLKVFQKEEVHRYECCSRRCRADLLARDRGPVVGPPTKTR